MDRSRLPRKVYEELRAEGRRASFTGVVERLARSWGLGAVWDNQRLPESEAGNPVEAWRARLRSLAKKKAVMAWSDEIGMNPSRIANNYAGWMHADARDDGMQMAEYVSTAGFHDDGAKVLAALRTGTSELRVDAARRTGIDHDLRLCQLCTMAQVEDVPHVLAGCPAHARARTSLRSKLPPMLRNFDDPVTANALMGGRRLRELCADTAVREAVTEAVKAFWLNVYSRRGTPASGRTDAEQTARRR
jgi:Mrp family chromosome partitioning ATPase